MCGVAFVAAPTLLVLAASTSANVVATGEVVPYVTSGGFNLWLGNNPDADGVNPFLSGPREGVVRAVAAQATDAVDADRLYRQRAVSFWRDEPHAAIRLVWKKLLWTWTDRELPNTGDIEWETSQSALFHWRGFPLRLGIVLPLAAAGALLLGHEWRGLVLLAAPVAIPLATSVLFFTNARFRLVMVPSLLLLAAAAIVPRRLAAGAERSGPPASGRRLLPP